ncbi:MAG: transcriptional regulator [Zestosphaera sp.]
MKTFCEVFVKHVLPSLRLYLAVKMVSEHGFSQLEASRLLGISQPLVNYVVNKRRKPKMIERLTSMDHLKSELDRIAKDLAEGRVKSESLACDLCVILRREGVIEQIARDLSYGLCVCDD